jgi:hypothetical protein
MSNLHCLGTLPTNINGIHGETQKKHKPWKLLSNFWYIFPKLRRQNQMKSFRQFFVGVKSGLLALREQLKLSNSVNTVRRRTYRANKGEAGNGGFTSQVRGV